MRQAYAHDAVLSMDLGEDERSPGAAVTVALCGHWEHEPPCPLAPHHVHVRPIENQLQVRVLFAAESELEDEIRRRIQQALSGQWELPAGLQTRWQLIESRPGELSPDESDLAERLIHD